VLPSGSFLWEEIMKFKIALASATILAVSMFGAASAADLTVGFSQIGSESGWRAAETSVTKQQAEARGIDLKFADAQQKQENQIKAMRGPSSRRVLTPSSSHRSSPPAGTRC
jgi:ABC-type sugar transport system substrate-binding protein